MIAPIPSITHFSTLSLRIHPSIRSFACLSGGINGSIRFELKRPENDGLKRSIRVGAAPQPCDGDC